MIGKFQNIINYLLCQDSGKLYNAELVLNSSHSLLEKLNAAFAIMLAGEHHQGYILASEFIKQGRKKENQLTEFLLETIKLVTNEVKETMARDDEFRNAMLQLEEHIENQEDVSSGELREKIWSVFFPEGVGVFENHSRKAKELRKKRLVEITKAGHETIQHPAREIIFTSNVLLTIPGSETNIDQMNYSNDLKNALKKAAAEPQLYWFDHPVQIGVEPDANEIIHGLFNLDKSLEKEIQRKNIREEEKATCILSVSVTHQGLHPVAKEYIRQEINNYGTLKNLDVLVFTENDTRLLIREVFKPCVNKYFPEQQHDDLLQIFGVDGEYGRHYSFLKAIAVWWQVLIDNQLKATFKIDLDQVFPQEELIEQTGRSALEHFKTPLWGATGITTSGNEIELGMIAGALVNEKDISKGIFTPDVTFPEEIPDKEANVFFSKMLMAFSTEGELMTRYQENSEIDGKNKCIQRVHVTGGTNGILVSSLRKHRPFTPTFIGRAEDQAYLLSVLCNDDQMRLGYLHQDGLIMRHDKEAFASDAMKAAKFGNIVGDYIRTLYFSEYARVLTKDVKKLKDIVNPFTGCFISKIPITVCMMRYVLRAAEFFENGETDSGERFMRENAPRLKKAMDFIKGEQSDLKKQIEKEGKAWDLYYDVLNTIESEIRICTDFAREITVKAKNIMNSCKIV